MSLIAEGHREVTRGGDQVVTGVPFGVPAVAGWCPGSDRCARAECAIAGEAREFRRWPDGPYCHFCAGQWSPPSVAEHAAEVRDFERVPRVVRPPVGPDVWPKVKPGGIRERLMRSAMDIREDAGPENVRAFLDLFVEEIEERSAGRWSFARRSARGRGRV